MSKLKAAELEMIDAGGRTAQALGVNRLLGQVYTFLYLSSEPQCLDEIAEQLGVSKASVSITCRQLEGWGAVHRVWLKGDRRDYYQAETDFNRIISNGLLTFVNKKLDSAKIQIDRSLSLLEEYDGEDSRREFLEERLKEAERYRSKITKLLNNPIVRSFVG